ncbi:MAG: cbb3-type cytochrome c oxidase subunit I, partial [Thermoleophilaceae bacterium]|nr:cbb3-type cytochrome c oxidase subunit I [Thermoleophilaceae bacterium]
MTTVAKLAAPGWYRAALSLPIGLIIGAGLVIGLRAFMGKNPLVDGESVTTACLITVPMAFLVGIGCFDYWFRWASGAPTVPEDHSGHGARSWRDYFRVNTDHKVIGIQYIVTTFVFFILGGLMAMIVRAELFAPGSQLVDANTYNGLFSVHASLMIFLFVIPAFSGIANYVIPLMIGAPDMAFPRLNALSYWMLPVAGVMMILSYAAPGGAFATGWTAYAPLSTQMPLGQAFFTMGVQFAGASSIATALNFLVTIITMRAPGMTFFRMPLLVWANFTTSLLVVIATPFIAGSQFMILLDRALHANFFQSGAAAGGDVVMYQHVFWFYSHPAVYIMILPGMGVMSELIAAFTKKRVFGYSFVAFSSMAIAILGFMVWGHHMFTTGQSPYASMVFSVLTMLVAVPSAVKVFNWTATLYKGSVEMTTPMLYAIAFIGLFTIGGLTGVFLGIMAVDRHVHDTYFVVAHFHYVMVGSMVMAFLG